LTTTSTEQILNRPNELLVARLRVDASGQNRLVSGESLNQPNVLGPAVEHRTARVPQTMNAEESVEPGAYLPLPESGDTRPLICRKAAVVTCIFALKVDS